MVQNRYSADIFQGQYTVMLYESGKEKKIGKIDGETIKHLFNDNLSGWSYDNNSYVPKLKLMSLSTSIVCTYANKIVINQKSFQVSKDDLYLCDKVMALVDSKKILSDIAL